LRRNPERGEEGKEALEAREELGAAMVRGPRRRTPMSPFAKEKTGGAGRRRSAGGHPWGSRGRHAAGPHVAVRPAGRPPEEATPPSCHVAARPALMRHRPVQEGRRRRPSRSRSGREPRRAKPLLFCCAPRRHQPAAASEAGEPVLLAWWLLWWSSNHVCTDNV
jgi:hypothetical protein